MTATPLRESPRIGSLAALAAMVRDPSGQLLAYKVGFRIVGFKATVRCDCCGERVRYIGQFASFAVCEPCWASAYPEYEPYAQHQLLTLEQAVQALVKRYGGVRAAERALGVDKSFISRLMNGKKTAPSTSTLEKLGLRAIPRYVPLERTHD